MNAPEKLREWMGGFTPKLRQSEVAERLAVTEARLSYWLSGKRQPNLKEAVAIDKLTFGRVPARDWVA